MATPYEYYNDQLGAKAKYLIKGRNMAENSIQVIGERGLQHRISNGYIKRLRANGPNTPMLVSWLTLPPEWQRALIERFGEPAKQIKESWFKKHYKRDTEALEYYMTYKLPDGRALSDTTIEEYTANASVLNAVQSVYNSRHSLRRSMRGSLIDVWQITSVECNRFRDVVPHNLPSNPAALRRKLNEYKKGGYDVLIHKNFANANARRVTDDTIELLNNMFATQTHKPTATEISRQYDAFLDGYLEVINNATGEMYDPAGYRKLSRNTITNYLAKWENRAGTHTKRSGDRQKWMGKYQPYHSMEAPKYAGSLLSIDDRQPPFVMDNGKRVWFYNGVDLASEAITVWVYGHTKEGIITEFYRQMIRNYTAWGISLPLELEAESALNSSFKDTFLKEGVIFEHVRIEANNARAKRIERVNEVLRYEIEKEMDGWRARPDARSEANQLGPGKQKTLPYQQIVDQALQAIWIYNNSEHPHHPGKTRWDIFLEKQHPEPRPTKWRAFLPTLGIKTETSCNNGFVKLQRNEFVLADGGQIAYSDKLISLLSRIEGKEIDIYWLDGHQGEVIKALVYLRGTDTYVCELLAKPTYNRSVTEQTPADLEAREQMSKYAASVTGYINRKTKSIDQVTIIDNRPKVLNTRFEMPGMRKPVSAEIEPMVEAIELPELPEENELLNVVETSFKRSLNDRF